MTVFCSISSSSASSYSGKAKGLSLEDWRVPAVPVAAAFLLLSLHERRAGTADNFFLSGKTGARLDMMEAPSSSQRDSGLVGKEPFQTFRFGDVPHPSSNRGLVWSA